VHYMGSGARATLSLGDEWSVRPTRALLEGLGRLVGRDGVRIMYGPGGD